MSIPVSNSQAQEDKALDRIPFPAWFLATVSGGNKISDGTNYTDVHVTKADGTTELPCKLNSDKNKLYVDYANMPLGRTTIYVYYGKANDSAPATCSYWTQVRNNDGIRGARTWIENGGSLIDSGFENGTDGSPLDTGIWTASGTPTHLEYDTSVAKIGSKSAWLQGQTTTTNAGMWADDINVLNSDGAEIRFWTYFDSTNEFRYLDDVAGTTPAADRIFYLAWSNLGALIVRTDRAGNPNGYTTNLSMTVDNYSTGWTQYRIVINFSAQTYTLSKRSNIGDSWVGLKATAAPDYNIPFRGANTISQAHGMLFRVIYASPVVDMWVDDIRFSNTAGAITDLEPIVSTKALNIMDANNEQTADDDTSPTYYLWGENLEATHISKGANYRYFGTDTSNKIGYKLSEQDKSLFLNGFEDGSDGTVLPTTVPRYGIPQVAEFDTEYKKNGNLSAKLTGPTDANYAGITETMTGGISSDNTEITFWTYFDTTTQSRIIRSTSSPTPFYLLFSFDAKVYINTTRTNSIGIPTNAYVPIATYELGSWRQWKIIFNFTNSTYTVSYRANVVDAWTLCDIDSYSCPVWYSTSTRISVSGLVWWADQYNGYSVTITDGAGVGQTRTIIDSDNNGSNESYIDVSPSFSPAPDETSTIRIGPPAGVYDIPMYSSGVITQHRGIDFLCNQSTNMWIDDIEVYDSSWVSSNYSNEYNYLIKYFEGALPIGTVSSAELHLHMTPHISDSVDLRLYRLKGTGDANADIFYGSIVNGWTNQECYGFPKWKTRMQDPRVNTIVPWKNPGAMGTDEIDSTEYVSLSLNSASTIGYKKFDITSSWFNDWINTDRYSLGMVIGYSGGAGNDRYVDVYQPNQPNSPVIVVTFSSVDSTQLTKRRLSSDTYTNYATFPIQSRNSVSSDINGYMVQMWTNGDLRNHIAIADPVSGRIYRVKKDLYPSSSSRWGANSPTWGVHQDPSTGRYWMSGNDVNGYLVLGYTEPYSLNSWTMITNTNVTTGKSAMTVVDDVAHCFVLNGIMEPTDADPYKNKLDYVKYTRSTNSWSSTTTIVEQTVTTKRNLVNPIGIGDTLDGTTDILADGPLDSYPSFGFFEVDTEKFWYQSKDGNTFKNVTRAAFGTTAAAHTASTQCKHLVGIPTYTSIVHDSVRNCLHVSWSYNKVRGASSNYEYMAVGYLRHYYSDSDNIWKKSDDTSAALPYIPANIELISTNLGLCYPNTLLCNSHGDIIQTYSRTNVFSSPSYNKPYLSYKKYGDSSWTVIENNMGLSHNYQSVADLGGDKVAMTTVYSNSQKMATSENNGATWGSSIILSSHSANVRNVATNNGMSEGSSVNGFSLSYYQLPGTAHGNVWLNVIDFKPLPPTNVVATLDGNHIDIQWTDNSSSEGGYYIDYSTNGGATWTTLDHSLVSNTANYVHTITQMDIYTYRVACYDGAFQSDWAYSNSVSAITTNSLFFGMTA